MNWSKPELVEINMSAEVGAYQDDSDDRDEPRIDLSWLLWPSIVFALPRDNRDAGRRARRSQRRLRDARFERGRQQQGSADRSLGAAASC